MELEIKILQDLWRMDGRVVDEKYRGDQYLSYKRAVRTLNENGYIIGVIDNSDTVGWEDSIVSLKNAELTAKGEALLKSL